MNLRSKQFWKLHQTNKFKIVKPDIVIHNENTKTKIILDTKWKLPDNNIPADDDLKQMFVYNEYWTGKTAVLLYPNAAYTTEPIYHKGSFVQKKNAVGTHDCGVMKMSVLDKDNAGLDSGIGYRINKFLKDEILK